MNCTYILLCICFLQLFLILHLFSLIHQKGLNVEEKGIAGISSVISPAAPSSLSNEKNYFSLSQCPVANVTVDNSCTFRGKPKGVAVTLMLHTPLWYQRRYTMMIQNTIDNIPDDWVVQIFYTPQGGSLKGLTVNPGIQRFVEKKRVVLTVIPDSLLKRKKKRFELMAELWLWENMLADKVLTFGGGSVICSNSPHHIQDFLHFDYIGPTWNSFKGLGGDGSISIRSRKLMIDIIKFEYSKYKGDKEREENGYKNWGQEDMFFVSRLKEMIQKGLLYNTNKMIGGDINHAKWKKIKNNDEISVPQVFIANRNDSMTYAASGSIYNNDVWAVSGTLPDIPFIDRDKFIGVCPEIKMHYPALHDPHCFGASPDSEKCAASICALKSKTERKGGC
jgi:hypothetical protein